MKQISLWAKHHVVDARIILISLHILLTTIAIYWGVLAYRYEWGITEAAVYALLGVYALLYIIYNKSGKRKTSYSFRTLLHTAMGVVSFLLVFVFTAACLKPSHSNDALASVPVQISETGSYKNPEVERLLNAFKKGAIKKFTRQERKLLRGELKYQVNRYNNAIVNGQKKQAGDAGLIILTIILELALLFGVGSLACTLSCNGNEGAAVAVLILGTGLMIFLMILAFRGIKKRKTKQVETKKEQTSS